MRFTITGTGFLPDQPADQTGITIRVVDGVSQEWKMIYTSSDGTGAVNTTLEALNITKLQRDAANVARLHFSGTDKRKDPNSVPANEPLWSNTVTLTF